MGTENEQIWFEMYSSWYQSMNVFLIRSDDFCFQLWTPGKRVEKSKQVWKYIKEKTVSKYICTHGEKDVHSPYTPQYNTDTHFAGQSDTSLHCCPTVPTPAGDPASPLLYTAANPLSCSQRLLWKLKHEAGAKMSALLAGGQLICVENRALACSYGSSVLRCTKKKKNLPKSIISLFRRCVSCSFQGAESADFSAGKQQPLTHCDTC